MAFSKNVNPPIGLPRTHQVASHIKAFDISHYSRMGHHLSTADQKGPFHKENLEMFHRPSREVHGWLQALVEDPAYIEADQATAEAAKEDEVEVWSRPRPRAARGKKHLLVPGVHTPDVLVVVDKKPNKRGLTDAADAAGSNKLDHGAANTDAIFTALLGTDAPASLEKIAEAIAKAPAFGAPKATHLSAMLKDLDSQLATTACALGVHFLVHQHLQEQRTGVASLLAGLPAETSAEAPVAEQGKGKGKGKRPPKSKAVISEEMDVDTLEEAAPQAEDDDADGSDAETVMPATDA
ncbi:hypothetical protein BD626DRAFT_573196 [Schizophyllum amplum]|uniref:Uncharacterized protein n=1 Tax=Schizophyllum amplum TaxID=97359 RepID=A0A550BSY5_9AGAR|nr:hypothetical protein BD626DRAFT_576950 [Auriculariopsis ampla]TRM58940.1 hypothetical protein BD626DRAFT_573196 [Auriculariopsis ampla]